MLALLPIETRLRRRSRWPNCARATTPGSALPLDPDDAESLARGAVRGDAAPGACTRGRGARARLLARRRSPRTTRRCCADGLVEVPAWRHALINYPHPLLQARPGGARHAGAERDRRRARADAGAAARGACRGLRARRRHRRDASPTSAIWREHLGGAVAGALRRAQQDRHAGRPAGRRRRRSPAQIEQPARQARAATLEVAALRASSPLSAREALAARVAGDASRAGAPAGLPALEAALAAASCCRASARCSCRPADRHRAAAAQQAAARRLADRRRQHRRADARAARPARQEQRPRCG
ncbi:MAG: hypothetical protein MZW92_62910 [Comamonadaceae bacterium]|nr:hypothetical protein [Comamonadaceae bacterium]